MLLYVTTSSGVVLNVHYCMGKISDVKVDFTKSVCECGIPKKDKSCCTSEYKIIKLEDVHKSSLAVTSIDLPVAEIPLPLSLIDNIHFSEQHDVKTILPGPPLLSSPDIHILNAVFKI